MSNDLPAGPLLKFKVMPIPADLPPEETYDDLPYFLVIYRGGGEASMSAMKVYLWA